MLSLLLAFRGSWVGILFILAGVAVVWLAVRAGIDFARWFREEIIEDARQRKKRKKESEKSDRGR
jgi:hypothetical protein